MLVGAALATLLPIVIRFVDDVPSLAGNCIDKTVKEFPSPTKEHVALVVLTNCGATSSFVTSIEVRFFGRKRSDGDYLFSVVGQNDMEVVWNDHHITVAYERPTQIIRQTLIWYRQRMEYREKS
jgi:hypothetical protein